MDSPPDVFQFGMIVSFDCSGSFDLQLSNTGFDRSLVDTDNIVMRVL